MPTNYNFRDRPDYLKLAYPNSSNPTFDFWDIGVFNLNGISSYSLDTTTTSPLGSNPIKFVLDGTSVSAPRANLQPNKPLGYLPLVTKILNVEFWYKTSADYPGVGTQLYVDVRKSSKGLENLLSIQSSYGTSILNSTNWTKYSVSNTIEWAGGGVFDFSGFWSIGLTSNAGTAVNSIVWIADLSVTFANNDQTYTRSFDDQFIPADAFRQGNLLGSGWNDNNFGTIGDGTTIDRTTPTLVFGRGSNWKTFSITKTAYTVTSAIKTDGTLWSWGGGVGNQFGGQGVNNTNSTQTPVQEFTSSTNWVMVSNGYRHTAAIKSDGTLWTWGSNDNGELGVNNTIRSWTPIQEFTSSTNWKYVNATTKSTFAIKTDGTLWAWGQNFGFLGTNDNAGRTTPVQIGTDNKWKMVDSQQSYSFALKTDGTLWWWGQFSGSLLGLTNYSTPVQYDSNTDWKIISNSAGHVMGIKNSGEIWGWGRSDSYELGLNSTGSLFSAILLHPGDWRFVHASQSSTFAISSDGTLWGWGANTNGKLGLPFGITYSTPTIVNSSKKWKMVQGSGYTTNYISYIDPII